LSKAVSALASAGTTGGAESLVDALGDSAAIASSCLITVDLSAAIRATNLSFSMAPSDPTSAPSATMDPQRVF